MTGCRISRNVTTSRYILFWSCLFPGSLILEDSNLVVMTFPSGGVFFSSPMGSRVSLILKGQAVINNSTLIILRLMGTNNLKTTRAPRIARRLNSHQQFFKKNKITKTSLQVWIIYTQLQIFIIIIFSLYKIYIITAVAMPMGTCKQGTRIGSTTLDEYIYIYICFLCIDGDKWCTYLALWSIYFLSAKL